MSDAVGVSRDIYGSPEDWGLSKPKHSEICAELEDHLYCLQAEEGIPAADAARDELNKPQTRRKLAGVHLTNQVYATLNRLPTKQEWRELIFLLVCFAAILLGDWLATKSYGALRDFRPWFTEAAGPPQAGTIWLATSAWLLQGISRGAFYAGFIYSLWRAWQLGAGVLLARILQLKLIHTVLVVAAMLLFSRTLTNFYFDGIDYPVPWTQWVTAPFLLAGLILLALLVFMLSRRRAWAYAMGIVFTVLFLYPGGPAVVDETLVTKPIHMTRVPDGQGDFVFATSTDQQAIERSAEKYKDSRLNYELDIAANKLSYTSNYVRMIPGIYLSRGSYTPPQLHLNELAWLSVREYQATGNSFVTGPLPAASGGIGWLAVPVPLLGLIGFFGLVIIMGRRGPVEFAAYSMICVLAIVATILPFFYGLPPADIFEFSPLGVMTTPLPGFEKILFSYHIDASWLMLVGGLVFSAGVPWLMTSLFLRPQCSVRNDTTPSGEMA